MSDTTMTAAERGSANSGPLPTGRRLIDVREMERLYKADDRSIFRWADAGLIPHGIKLGSLRRWDILEIEKHIAAGCPKVRNVSAIGGGR